MKNPQIKQRLVNMMEQERADKLEAIAVIIEHTVRREPNTDETELFNELYDMNKCQLSREIDRVLNENMQELEAIYRDYNHDN